MTDMNADTISDLLADLARDVPPLPGAACRGRSDLFDISDGRHRQAVEQAQAICRDECPVLRRCEEWLASLPKHRLPTGVVAGKFVKPPWLRPLPQRKPKPPTKRDRAAHWLASYLAAGPVLSTQVRADAAAAGIDIHNLARARRHLGVQLERTTGARGGQRWWTLPHNPNQGRRNTMTTLDQFNHHPPDDTPIKGVETYGLSFIINHQDIDLYGLILYLNEFGSLCVALTAEQAYDIAEGLLLMVRDREKLRVEYKERHPDE